MSAEPDDALQRLRAFATEHPVRAEELNEALHCIRAICPDFAFSGVRLSRRAAFTSPDGTRHELAGRTHGDLLGQAARLITGAPVTRDDRRGRGP